MSPSILAELSALPKITPSDQWREKKEVQVSLIIPAKNSTHALEKTVREAHQYLASFRSDFEIVFEIVLVPNLGGPGDQSEVIARKLCSELRNVRMINHTSPPGKGAALRTGVFEARGSWIFFTDSDLPYDLSFLDQALKKLESGFDLVTGNRRLPISHFHIPVSLLRIAHGRHRLGLGFNWMVRKLLPIHTTDTQAGIKGFSRRLGWEAFNRQTCPGFLFDLELLLTAQGMGWAQTDLPVTLYLNSEKSTVRILREFVLVANWLSRIWVQNLRGHYGNHSKKFKKILSRYQGADFSTRFFLWARWKLTPYPQMLLKLPKKGKVLDLGCGHGLLALISALDSGEREILGLDHDDARIALAQEACRDLPKICIKKGSMLHFAVEATSEGEELFSAITAIDVMHYFSSGDQKKILEQAHLSLKKGGVLLVREVNPDGGWISKWNRLYEKLATRIGFTRSKETQLYFRTKAEWETLLQGIGFKVQSERCSSVLFADILYTCEKY